MYKPKAGSTAERIIKLLTVAPASRGQIVAGIPEAPRNSINAALSNLITARVIRRVDGAYHLDANCRRWLEGARACDITPSRTPPVFRPIQAKYLPSLVPPRADAPPLRDISYCNGAFGAAKG